MRYTLWQMMGLKVTWFEDISSVWQLRVMARPCARDVSVKLARRPAQ
jgi:hypothetical protein